MRKDKKGKVEIVFRKWASLVGPKIKEILNLSVDKKTRKLVNYQILVGGKKLRSALKSAPEWKFQPLNQKKPQNI